MTPAQVVFQAMCRDLLSRGIKPTHKVIWDLQPRYRFRFVKLGTPWAERRRAYVLGTEYQQIRIRCLEEAGWVLGGNGRWVPTRRAVLGVKKN